MSTEGFDVLARRVGPLFDRGEAAGLSSLTGPERVLFSVWGAGGQIENGGFDQFFYNSSGDYAAEALDGPKVFDVHVDPKTPLTSAQGIELGGVTVIRAEGRGQTNPGFTSRLTMIPYHLWANPSSLSFAWTTGTAV